MSEKKNVIEIPVPAGYEQCERGDATHVLLNGWFVASITHTDACGKPAYSEDQSTYITAWLREAPKPKPFRVVFDSEIVRFKSREVDNHGYCYDVVESYGAELPGGVDPYREYKKVRVTIEEVPKETKE